VIKSDELSDSNSCFNKAADSERLFVLLARDPAAPYALRAWVDERVRLGKNRLEDGQIQEALDCARLMELERAEIESTRRQQKLSWAEGGSVSRSLRISTLDSKIGLPCRAEVTWQDLVAMLSTARRTECSVATCRGSACPHKDGPCWSPATFIVDLRAPWTIAAVSVLALDVDHQPEVAVLAMRDRLARYQYLLHATHTDRPGDRSLRVVIQLSRDVTPTEWPMFWQAAAHALEFSSQSGSHPPVADLMCADKNRRYFLPSRPHDADYFVEAHVGEALDVDAILVAHTQSQEARP